MNGISIVLGLVASGVMLLSIALPIMAARREGRVGGNPDALSVPELEAHLLRQVASVRDLDFDFDTGKLTEADYAIQRKLLIGRGVSALIRLDEARLIEDELDYEIEDLVAAYRQNS